jgi:hypothetical protein
MKRLLYLLALLLLTAAHAHGQSTIVTATVVDPRTFPYQAGTGLFSIQCPGNSMPYNNRAPLTRTIPITGLDGNGKFTQSIWDTSQITDVNNAPMSCQWRVSITDACQVATFSVLVTGVTGAGPVNLSSQINAAAVNLSAACTPPGIVNSVTIGSLPPLFNTSVTGNPLNPSFAFAQISENANLVFANCTGAPANPSFCSITSAMLPAGTGTVTNVTGTAPITSTGGATPAIACPTCVTSVSGTANQITSSGGTTPTLSLPATVVAPGSVQATTALRGATVTDDALTSGRCVQAGVGGLLGNATGPCPSGTILTATAAGCTTAGSNSFQTCDNTLTWSGGGFADTSYFPSCSGVDPRMQASGGDGSSGEVLNLNIRSFSATQITVTTTQLAARASKYDNVYCTGVHP